MNVCEWVGYLGTPPMAMNADEASALPCSFAKALAFNSRHLSVQDPVCCTSSEALKRSVGLGARSELHRSDMS